MTQEEQTLLMIKGAISDLPKEHYEEVMQAYRIIKEMIDKNPTTGMAIALIGAELSI